MPNPPSKFDHPEQTLFLVDISSFIFRAFFAIRSLTNRKGEPTNAVLGVTTMLAKLAEEARPQFLAVTYDSKGPGFREELYSDYKANRSEAPEDLVPQFARIDQVVEAMRFPSFRVGGVEADDLIATLTRRWCAESPDHRVVIVTGDKDLMQLVNSRVKVWDTMADKIYGPTEVEGKFGIPPEQVRDYLALVGDTSDNIPGVEGIGPKGATDLLKKFGTLEGILNAAADGQIPGKKGETIHAQQKEARLSAELASLKDSVDVEVSRSKLQFEFKPNAELLALCHELDFTSLIKRWGNAVESSGALGVESEGASRPAVTPPSGPAKASLESTPTRRSVRLEVGSGPSPFRCIQTEKDLKDALRGIEKVTEFALDLETTSLNPRAAEIVGIALSWDPQFGAYIPIGHRGTTEAQLPQAQVLDALKPFLEDPKYKKIGQNLKYDWSVLGELGIQADGIGADTMIASYVLSPEGRHNLAELARNYLDYTVQTYESVCGTGKDQIGFDQVAVSAATRYSAEDAWVSLNLWNELRSQLKQEKLMQVFAQVDSPLIGVLSRMERQGICIDVDWFRELSRKFERELLDIEKRVHAYTQGPVNLNSPKQLASLLFEQLKLPPQGKTKTGFSTDAEVLEALSPLHEVPRLLLEYREIAKLKGTYVDPLPGQRDSKTGKIHASFHQTVAATGRLSSSDPNLQNIPIRTERGRMIRRGFVPSPGNVLLSADYSQIELRLLAHMSGDPDLSASFQKDEDVHRRTASEIYGIPPEQVDDRQRGIAKAINFGLMYGKTAFGLSQELKIPRKEAQDMITRYFERYRGVKQFLDTQVQHARETGWTTTLLGRKRYLPQIQSKNAAVRANGERMAMNAPLQGTAADMIKIAMIELDSALSEKGFAAKMIVQVHDELVLDVPPQEVAEVQKLVTSIMENAMKLNVPLKVNSGSGANWMEI